MSGAQRHAVGRALEAIETAADDAAANVALQAALDLGAGRGACGRAWRNRVTARNYRQPMARADEPVTRCVSGKLRYPDRHRAGKALNDLLRIRAVRGQTAVFEQRAYPCDRGCGGWHLTSKATATEDVA